MGNVRITIPLEQGEKSALMKLAKTELRDPRQQAAFIIRQALERAGMVDPTPPTTQKNKPESE